MIQMYKLNVEGGRGRETRRKGDGRCTEGRRDKAGSRIPKVAESGRKKEKLCNIVQFFTIGKLQRGRSQQIQGGNRD